MKWISLFDLENGEYQPKRPVKPKITVILASQQGKSLSIE